MASTYRPGMTVQEATRLVTLAREARWSYPSSQGRPVRWDSHEEWVERLVREQGSFVEAARVLIENNRNDMAIEMAANIWRLWILSRDIPGGRQLLAPVLEKKKPGKPTRAEALALYGDGLFAFRQGKLDESRKRNEEALRIGQLINDPESQALSHLGLSRVDFEEGNFESALSHASKARKLASGLGPALGQAPLFMHAQSTRMLGDYEEAASLFEQSVDLNRRIGDKGMVVAELTNLGFVEIHRGNGDAAQRYFSESEKLSPSLSDPYSQAIALLTKAAVAFLKGDHAEARSLLTQSERSLKDSGIEVGPDDKSEFDWLNRKLAEASVS